MSLDFNVNHIPFRIFCDKLVSIDTSKNLIIESSKNNIEVKTNNKKFNFNNNSVFNYGINLSGLDLSNIINLTCKTLNVNTLFLTNTDNGQIDDTRSIENGYIRATTIGYNSSISNDFIGRSSAYFTYINVSGGDSSFNNSLYIKNWLRVSGTTTISNDLIVNGTSYVTLYNAINNYIAGVKEELISAKIVTNDVSASNISISNELVVNKTTFLNDLNIYGQMLNNVLKVPTTFTIDPIIPIDLILYNFQYYSWTINSSYTGLWRSVCWSPKLGMFVAVGSNSIYNVIYSYNGKDWFPGTHSSNNARNGVCWSQELEMFVAVGYELMYSYNGITWSSTNVSGVDASKSWRAPCWSAELVMFVACSNGGTGSGSYVMYSYNGINWIQTNQIVPNNGWSSICWSPQRSIFVAVAISNSNNVMYSEDGINWNLITATPNYYFGSVCWSTQLLMFVAVASTSVSNNVMYSYDGIYWTTITVTNGCSSVCWSPQLGIFLAIASYGTYKVIYSYNGKDWSNQNVETPEVAWGSVCWSPELRIFIAVGNTSNVMMSSLQEQTNNGTLIVNGDLKVYGVKSIIESNIVEISGVALSLANNLINNNDLSTNSAGIDISNVASLKYNGTVWNFVGGQLTVENKKVCFDVSFINFKSISEASLNSLNSYFDSSYSQLKRNYDNSFDVIYTRSQIDNSFITYSDFDISWLDLKSYATSSYVSTLQFDASFRELKTYLDASYIIIGNVSNPNIIDSSLIFLNEKLDLMYVLKSTFEASYTMLKEQIEISFASIRPISLDSSTISIETINTKHYSQRFNNIFWNQIGLDIGV